jgi:hypothetical protein
MISVPLFCSREMTNHTKLCSPHSHVLLFRMEDRKQIMLTCAKKAYIESHVQSKTSDDAQLLAIGPVTNVRFMELGHQYSWRGASRHVPSRFRALN